MEKTGSNVIKLCTKCGLPRETFYESNKSWCKPCVDTNSKKYRKPYDPEKAKLWRDKNKPRLKEYWKKRRDIDNVYRKDYMAKYRYGMSRVEYEEFTSKPCEVCGDTSEPRYVDHCHNSSKVRGCLCRSCNSALGQMKDNPLLIQRLKEYIERHQTD